jgi:methionyl-tRNA formyltransferase
MSKNNLKFAFFGTPSIAAETLEILKRNGFLPSLIVTATDKPSGRKMILTSPPVKTWAIQNNIPFLQPEKLEKNIITEEFDLFIVVAYGKIFPQWLIDAPKFGTLNIHYSLLPKYRGASPVQSAILNGEEMTGVTIQKMVKELDAGPIVAVEKTRIDETENTLELLIRLVKLGAELLSLTLPKYINNEIQTIEQDLKQATFCGKIKKEDGLLDLNDDAVKNYNKFRAFYEWPRTYFIADGKRNIITGAELKDGKFIVKKIIPEGKKEIPFRNN